MRRPNRSFYRRIHLSGPPEKPRKTHSLLDRRASQVFVCPAHNGTALRKHSVSNTQPPDYIANRMHCVPPVGGWDIIAEASNSLKLPPPIAPNLAPYCTPAAVLRRISLTTRCWPLVLESSPGGLSQPDGTAAPLLRATQRLAASSSSFMRRICIT